MLYVEQKLIWIDWKEWESSSEKKHQSISLHSFLLLLLLLLVVVVDLDSFIAVGGVVLHFSSLSFSLCSEFDSSKMPSDILIERGANNRPIWSGALFFFLGVRSGKWNRISCDKWQNDSSAMHDLTKILCICSKQVITIRERWAHMECRMRESIAAHFPLCVLLRYLWLSIDCFVQIHNRTAVQSEQTQNESNQSISREQK